MAGPLAGLGAGQQIPLATSLQPNQTSNNQQVRPEREDQDQTPETNTVQAPNAPAADVQNSETGNQETLDDLRERALAASESSEPQDRGSIVDISV